MLSLRTLTPILTSLWTITAITSFGQTVLKNNSEKLDFDSEQIYEIRVPANTGRLQVWIEPFGTDYGDCDIYVRRDALPSPTHSDFSSTTYGNFDSVVI